MRKRRKQHRIRNGIGIAVLLILLAVIIWNVAEYYKLKRTAERYLKSTEVVHVEEPVDLVGLLDSYGVPYSPSVEKSFMGYLEEDLESQGMLSSSLDLFGLYINKTWEVEGIFRNDVTIGEMKIMQNFGMDFVRHKYGKERIREDLIYTCDEELENVTVASYYSSLKRPVVLYSCTANDLFYYFHTSLESMNGSKIFKIIKNLGNGLSLLESEVRKNIETINYYNHNSYIMMMGLYVPSDNFFLQRAGSVVIDKVNMILKGICDDYSNTVYIDASCLSFSILDGDFHLDVNGHKILKSIIEEKMDLINLVHENIKTEILEEKKNPETKDVKTAYTFTIEKWMRWIDDLADLPKRDYVEWAVAAEEALNENEEDGVSYKHLKTLTEKIPVEVTEEEKQGIEILVTERKIHEGFDLERYTITKDIKNDKLSLIGYNDW